MPTQSTGTPILITLGTVSHVPTPTAKISTITLHFLMSKGSPDMQTDTLFRQVHKTRGKILAAYLTSDFMKIFCFKYWYSLRDIQIHACIYL